MAGINPATGQFDPYYYGGNNSGATGAVTNNNGTFTNQPNTFQNLGSGQVTPVNPSYDVGGSFVNPNGSGGSSSPAPSGGGGGGGGGGGAPAAPATVVSVITKRRTGGWVDTVQVMSDGSQRVIDSYQDLSAKDSALAMFRAAGLDEAFVNALGASIDAVYASNVMPTDAQILSAIYNSDAYKKRFAGNEVIRKRMADGQGRPGDALLTPKEYIDLENTYRQIFQDAEMPVGFYDSISDFTNLIANGISAAELKDRVQTAHDALTDADSSIKNALSQFYGLTTGDLVAYLLDPTKAQPILLGKGNNEYGLNSADALERAYRVSEVGALAGRQGLTADKSLSEEIVQSGKQNSADSAFGAGAAANDQLKRLGSLYSEPLDYRDLVRESLNLSGGATSGRKRKKLASKERAAFNGQGAIDKTSLSKATDV